ncbi:laccase domain protein [Devosia pacifica]|uniref:Purine nucleoside phosphorylase n=1 Tax=Devosia pacifica TaxID=1335967 RepID=A0A918RYF2_9HYPH|nr:peptidoglycan editing factor PgeF [Devosia pacifica]GHA17222.1 laccase domain protein [Devosia pacifica]
MIPYEQSALLNVPALRHGFFGRRGGVSAAPYASLNAGASTQDSPEDVTTNRARIAAELGFPSDSLVVLRQIHSARVEVLEAVPSGTIEADGMVTTTVGLALGILTADCTPILLADPAYGVIGAAHAGWRGARDGVLEAVIDEMLARGARHETIVAAIGPTISAENYEVGAEFMAQFLATRPEAEPYFTRNNGAREHFDLPGYVGSRLRASGVSKIERVGGCTYASPETYYSHRYATHHQTTTGRQLAVIARHRI